MARSVGQRVWILVAFLLMGEMGFAARHSLAADTDGRRPNILFAFADDWGRHAGAYAKLDGAGTMNDAVQTPVFDELTSRGVLFRNAFVNAPSCTPCRSSLLSGQYFWRTGRGAILQGAVWDAQIPAWPLLLRKGGYDIGKTWKVWSPGRPADAPYGGNQFVYQQAGSRFNGFSQTVTRLVTQGVDLADAKAQLFDEVRENFTSFLTQRQSDSPFCYWFGPTNVHRKWIKGSGQKLWSINPDDLAGRLPAFLPDVPEIREDLADYFGEIAAFDTAVGVLIEELRRTGELDNTLIVVSGDHGAPGFPHGKCNLYDFGTRVSLTIAGPGVNGQRVVDDMVSLPDLAPTFLEAAGLSVPEVMTARSLWPVLTATQSGQVDAARDAVFIGRERHVQAARAGGLPYPQRAIRTADALFIINFHPERNPLGDLSRLTSSKPPSVNDITENTFVTLPDEDAGPTKAWLVAHRDDPQWRRFFTHAYGRRPREELFDLRRDPDQMNNVAVDPAYSEKAAALRTRLLDELARTGDPRLVDDGAFFETPPMAGLETEDDTLPRRKIPKPPGRN